MYGVLALRMEYSVQCTLTRSAVVGLPLSVGEDQKSYLPLDRLQSCPTNAEVT